MGLGSKNGAVLRAIVEMLAFVLLLERLFSGEAKKKKTEKHVNDLCQISSKKTNHLHHVETKRGDVRRKSARQQNVETGNDRAEERDGCVFFYLFTLLSSTLSSRERVEGKSIV